MPDDRIVISTASARTIVAAQFPSWAALPVTPVDPPGWDNRSFRLGPAMKLRFPSAARYVAQVEKEARWLPVLAPHLPLPVPEPLAVGAPGAGYPFPWPVQSWLPGRPASLVPPDDPVRFALDLAAFIKALRAVPAAGGPAAGAHSFHRGGRLAVYDAESRACLAALAGRIDAAQACAVWEAALATPWPGPPVWLHGDIAPGNLLVTDGRLSGVIDFGTSAVGDRAADLVIAWTFRRDAARATFRAALPDDPAAWSRARGWALWKALLTLAGGTEIDSAGVRQARVIADVLAEHPAG